MMRTGSVRPLLALRLQECEPIASGQAEIEQQQLERLAIEHRFRGARLAHPVDGETIALQSRAIASPIIGSSSTSSSLMACKV